MNHLYDILETVLLPLGFVLDAGKRIHVVYLLSAVCFATGVFVWQRRHAPRRFSGVLRYLFAPSVWLHRSALMDLKLLWTNAVLKATVLAPLLVSTLAVTLFTVDLIGGHSAEASTLTRLQLGAAYTVALFVADDLTRYLVHRLMHRVPILWEIHQVHHSAPVMTPFTLFRTHPVEVVVNSLRATITIGVVVAIFFHFFGASLVAYDIMGVNALGFGFAFAGANLRHSHVWLSYGKRMEHVLISPAQHQLHHGRQRAQQSRNYGAFLALWDWIGGSLVVATKDRPPLRFGLLRSDRNHGSSLVAMIVDPMRAVARRLAPRRQRNMRWLPWVAVAISAVVYACVERTTTSSSGDESSSTASAGPVGFDQAALLTSIGENIVLPAYAGFISTTEALEQATAAYAASQSTADRQAAQLAWREAMSQWQRAELLQLGPAGLSGESGVAGGADLRDEIYSWPLVNPCRVDQEVVEASYNDRAAFKSELVNVRGLDAIEYLLFNESTENACAPQNTINSGGTWNALSSQDLAQRRADYAASLAFLVRVKAQELHERWHADNGDFVTELTRAGAGSSTYETTLDGLNAVSDAMFYIEKHTKDAKLAIPLGLSDCTEPTCPSKRESRYANASKQHILDNLLAFRTLFVGGDPDEPDALGFDDMLVAAGAEDVSKRLIANIDAAIASVEAIEQASLADALAKDEPAVVAVYDALATIADDLKTQFVIVLLLELPDTVAGDND